MDSNAQTHSANTPPADYMADAAPGRASTCPSQTVATHRPRLAFWKVTAVGLGIGLMAGAALGDMSMEQLLALLNAGPMPLAEAMVYAALMSACGTLGAGLAALTASLWQPVHKIELSPSVAVVTVPAATEKSATPLGDYTRYSDKSMSFPVSTILYTDEEGALVDTHERDRVLSNAKQALLSLDHTKVIPH